MSGSFLTLQEVLLPLKEKYSLLTPELPKIKSIQVCMKSPKQKHQIVALSQVQKDKVHLFT